MRDIYDPEKIKRLHPIHEEWKKKVKEVIENNQTTGLLNAIPCGTGKTTSTEFIFSNPNYQIVWLMDRHIEKHDSDNTISRLEEKGIDFIYLKGRDIDGMCFYNEEVKQLSERYINVEEAKCKNCDKKDECEYNKQFERLNNNPDLPVIGVHQHINTKIIVDRFDNSNLPHKVLVFDENPILKMLAQKEIRVDKHDNDLEKLEKLFFENNDFQFLTDSLNIIKNITATLKILGRKTRASGLFGFSFVHTSF